MKPVRDLDFLNRPFHKKDQTMNRILMNKRNVVLLAITSLLLSHPQGLSALPLKDASQRRTPVPRLQLGPQEIPDDEYRSVPLESRVTSPAYRYQRKGFMIVQVNVDSTGMNIVGDAANEPSIAVHPTDPDKLAIGWRQFDTISSNFRQAGHGYSTDGGQSWTFSGVLDPGVFRSDPVLGADAQGNFFYYSLAVDPDYFCTLYKDSSGGASWDTGVYAYGGDKAWMAVDRTDGEGQGQIYFAWDYAGCCGDNWFTRSTNEGDTFDSPVPIPDEPIWGVTTVGPDGSVYVAGRRSSTNTKFVMARSTTMQDSTAGLVFDYSMEVDMGGDHQFAIGYGPNPGGLQGQVWIAADHSTGPTAGSLYMLCSVDPPGDDPLDVHFISSADGGTTWSSPVRINDDSSTSAWQWFGTMSVSPAGRIDVIWLDTRNGPGLSSALFYSYSTDGGTTWSQNEQLSDPFDPHLGWPNQDKLGDYFDMVSEDDGAHLAWAATFNNEQDVYYSWIESPVTTVSGDEAGIPAQVSLLQNYPNPFNGSTRFEFRTATTSETSLIIYDLLGREVGVLVNGMTEAGTHAASWDGSDQAGGVYFYRLRTGDHVVTRKLVLVK